MSGDEVPRPRPAPEAGSTQAMFDDHYAGVLAGAAAGRPGGVAGGGGFRVDPESYRVAIAKLTEAVEEMEAGQQRWTQYQTTGDIGIDPVSIQLRENMDKMAWRAMEYARIWTGQLRDTRDALQAQLDSYEAVERRIAERMT